MLQATPGRPDNADAARIEADLASASEVEFMGTVEGPEHSAILVTFTNELGQNCYSVYSKNGSTDTLCMDSGEIHDPVQLFQTSDKKMKGLVVITPPEITEIRVGTETGSTYSVQPLGPLSYIEFDDDGTRHTLSLWEGGEEVYSR